MKILKFLRNVFPMVMVMAIIVAIPTTPVKAAPPATAKKAVTWVIPAAPEASCAATSTCMTPAAFNWVQKNTFNSTSTGLILKDGLVITAKKKANIGFLKNMYVSGKNNSYIYTFTRKINVTNSTGFKKDATGNYFTPFKDATNYIADTSPQDNSLVLNTKEKAKNMVNDDSPDNGGNLNITVNSFLIDVSAKVPNTRVTRAEC